MIRNDEDNSEVDLEFKPINVGTKTLSKDDINILQDLEKKNNFVYNDTYVSEFLKCRNSPLYFIHNYCNISETGIPQLYTSDMMNKKYRRVIKSISKYKKCIMMASRQLGKMLDLNTPIPLPDGKFAAFKDIKPGDIILDNYGNKTKVIAESDIFYDKKCFKIKFDSGESIVAGAEHIWAITYKNKKSIVDTLELKSMFDLKKEVSIIPTRPIKKTQKFFNPIPNVAGQMINLILPDEMKNNTDSKLEDYLEGSARQRIDLLRGIMDTCGSINNRGCIVKSKKIFFIQTLLTSLGIKSKISKNILFFIPTNFYVFNNIDNRKKQFKYTKNFIDKKNHLILSIVETESVPCKCIQVDSKDKLFLCGKSMIPTHNSTIAACLLAHAITFFPGIRSVVFNMDMSSAQENIAKVRFIIENLPVWMRFLPKKAITKTYLDLTNGSKISAFYPSTIKSPEQLSRSLTIPILYIDETAFIRHIDKIFTAAQPTLGTARQQAEKHGYPYWILMTSTPNGSQGTGGFFYDYWQKAIDSDELFEVNKKYTEEGQINQNYVYENFINNSDDVVNNPNSNSFIRIKYHWSEDIRKSQKWYEEQCKELNFNTRKIGQELDLEFVGTQFNPFNDDTLKKLQEAVQKPKGYLDLPHLSRLKLFKNITPDDYYIVGVDTASAIEGCYSAIQVFSFKNFEQVGELAIRVGSLNKYSEIVIEACNQIKNMCDNRLIIAIENNSIGKSIVEDVMDTDLIYNLYYERDKLKNGVITEYGISTNARTKPIMVSELYKFVTEGPEYFYSSDLIDQLHAIERNNAGQISSNSFTDLFMAACFCAYVRKMKELEIMPQITQSNDENEQKHFDVIKNIFEMTSCKNMANKQIELEENRFLISLPDEDYTEENDIFIRKPNESDLPFYFGI